jgi:hypothetical protein
MLAAEVGEQYVDPTVTRVKYEKELESFFAQYYEWQKKGVFLISDEFPVCEFLFLCPQLFPISAVYAVRIDFTNYDIEPPSVKFINPFTGNLIKREQIPVQFKQKATLEYIAQRNPVDPSEGMDICISIGGDHPFICHPGFKEYHDHPYHTGNPWILHRSRGEGRLYRILQILYSHSTALVESIGVRRVSRSEVQLSVNQKKPK